MVTPDGRTHRNENGVLRFEWASVGKAMKEATRPMYVDLLARECGGDHSFLVFHTGMSGEI